MDHNYKVSGIESLIIDIKFNVTVTTYISLKYYFNLGLALSGMVHITDQLWNSTLQKLKNARILVMGTDERMSMKIHVDHLIDAVAKNCASLERLEFRWDNDTLRFSDKNQKAIDLIRAKCLRLQSLVLCDGRLYEIMRGNFERADRRSVIRTSINCRVRINYLLSHYEEMLFT